MKNLILVILLIINTLPAESQTYDSAFVQNLADELIAERLRESLENAKKQKPEKTFWTEKNRCGFYVKDEKELISQYSAKFSPNWLTDFNADGEPDILTEISEINAKNEEFADFYLLLMQDLKVIGRHRIPSVSDTGFFRLTLDSVKAGRIFCRLEAIPKSFSKKTPDPLPLQLILHEGVITDQSALDCEFKPERRRIFIEKPDYRIDNYWSNSAFYFPKLEQVLTITGSERLFSAESEGCQTRKLTFFSEMPIEDRFSDKENVRKFVESELLFLKENTHFPRLFEELERHFHSAHFQWLDRRAEMEFELSAGWKVNLFFGKTGSEEEGEKFKISVNFIRRMSPEVDDFHEQWRAEISERFGK